MLGRRVLLGLTLLPLACATPAPPPATEAPSGATPSAAPTVGDPLQRAYERAVRPEGR